jgi:hypothetical protein
VMKECLQLVVCCQALLGQCRNMGCVLDDIMLRCCGYAGAEQIMQPCVRVFL